MDLSQYNFEKSGVVSLNGQWKFYWKKFYRYPTLQDKALHPDGLINLPQNWNDFLYQGKPIGQNGYATYHMRLKLPRKNMKLGFKMSTIATSYVLYVNGQKICANGKIATNRSQARPFYNPLVVNFSNPVQEIDIILLVSNYFHRKGGIWQEIQVGLEKQIDKDREINALADFFLMGSIVIMALYHLVLFWFRKKSISALYFSFVCITSALRLTVTDEYFLNDFITFDWFTLLRLEYLSMNLGMPATAWLIYSLYPQEYPKRLIQLQTLVFFILSLIVIIFPPSTFTHTVFISQLGILLSGAYAVVFTLGKAALHKREGALLFITGFVTFFLTIINDILYSNDVIETGNLFGFGLFFFIFSQAILLSKRFSNAFKEAEQLGEALNFTNQNLEELVGVRTHELKESNNKLNQSLEELDTINEKLIELDKFKQQMMSMIVHDLKNPLNSIIGLSDSQEDVHFFKTINQSGKRMHHLIMNILDVQRFEESKVPLVKEPVLLSELLATAHEEVHFIVTEKNHQITIQDLPEAVVEVDKDLITRVIVNLLTNASKYTPHQGTIDICVEFSEEVNGQFYKVLFKDSGVGIDPQHLDKIFSKFHQTTDKSRSFMRSTGLGLTFCKLVIEVHEGLIGVESQPGTGSTFWFTLPASAALPDKPVATTPVSSTPQKNLAYHFTTDEIQLLSPMIEKVKQYELFQISKIKAVIHPLHEVKSAAIQQWIEELIDALFTYDEEKFQALLQVIRS